jgi:hypothetical protein
MTDEDAQQQLEDTAEAWRSGLDGTDAEESANEVAQGADRAADQPGFGREGS